MSGPAPRGLAAALTLLLDATSEADQAKLAELERAIAELPYPSALALGVNAGGHLVFGNAFGDRMPIWAEERATENCKRLGRAPSCKVVWANGKVRMADLAGVAEALGMRTQAEVRSRFVGDVANVLARGRLR